MLRTLLLLSCSCLILPAVEPLVIHEWGTFTSLQDESGRTIGGINTDEEKLPKFVYDLQPSTIYAHGDLAPVYIKSMPAGAPDVTMRLETPVIYVHLPPQQQRAQLDITVQFNGGVLSQFYPRADVTVDNKNVAVGKPWKSSPLTNKTTSSLTWKHIIAGTSEDGPETDSHVWLAPRQIDAARLTIGDEHERYIFYRGLAHIDAPLIVMRDSEQQTLRVVDRPGDPYFTKIPTLWFADLTGDGRAAFRRIEPMNPVDSQPFSALFNEKDFSTERMSELKKELHTALVKDGLFADEAHAMLATWDASYFKSSGQRLFFLVPQAWTDAYLPMSISQPSTITRVMIGRIELVTPAQRAHVQAIAAGPISETGWYNKYLSDHIFLPAKDGSGWRPGGQELYVKLSGAYNTGALKQNNVPIPDDYAHYLALGRFRDALILDADRKKVSDNITLFKQRYLPYSR